MTISLLTTKLYFPPMRSNLVSRPHLVECLHNGLHGPLTLVSAPAGYGKTTLMSEWRACVGCDYSTAWLSLDNDDNDSTRFLTYIIAALATLKPGFGEIALGLLQSSPPLSTRVILTSLINELEEIDKTFSLVLDDYHVITHPSVHEAVTYLLDHSPPQMHLVILTRADPPLPLSRLRARNQLVEIRAADLRFTAEEAATFLNKVMGLALSVDQVGALEQRTEGWIAGLQLAALSMQGRDDVQNFVSAFTGSHHYIVDYLADEVLNSQPEPVQDFLLRTSILDRLTAPLCDALTNRTDGQTTLEKLENTNLFLIPLDSERCWYRYHHLFMDVLRSRLHQTYPGQIPDLYRRAADWFEQNYFFEEALNYYMQINEFEKAARLVSDHWLQILKQRTMSSFLALLKNFPDTLVRENPRLSLIYAWNLWLLGLRNEAEPYVLNTHQAMSRRSRLAEEMDSTPAFSALLAETSAFRSLIAIRHGEMVPAIKLAKLAVKTAPADEYYTRGIAYVSLYNAYREIGHMEDAIQACTHAITAARLGQSLVSTVDAIFNLGRLLKIQGRLHRAEQVYNDGLRVAENQGQAQLPAYSLIHFGLADVFYQWNNLDEAERHLNLGFRLLEQDDDLLISRQGTMILAQLKRARGDIQGALQILQEIEVEAHKKGMTTLLDEVVAYRVGLQVELGYAAEAVEGVKTIEIGIDEQLGYRKGIQAIQLARVFIAIGNLDKALDLLSRIEKSAEAGRSTSWQIEAIVLQAIVWKIKDSVDQSMMMVEKALPLAEPEGYVRIFLDEGEPMRALIAEYRSHIEKRLRLCQSENLESLNHFTANLLLAFPNPEAAASKSSVYDLKSRIVEPLSERELEVLRLVSEGKSNQQIADTLFIARGTVKKHLNNIFGKLGAQNRTQCVARARELSLM